MTEVSEISPTLEEIAKWEQAVLLRHHHKCANCEIDRNLTVRPIVPMNTGGQLVPSNGIVVCRRCVMVAEAATHANGAAIRRPINFLVSRYLYDRMSNGLKEYHGFKSMGSMIRYLMNLYIEDDARFEDLNMYQDDGSDVKVNVWVDSESYNAFKAKVAANGLSVTECLKALILLYEKETAHLKRTE